MGGLPIELFNRVHELETELTDEQLRAILLKTDSWLMYILQISSGNFHKQNSLLSLQKVPKKVKKNQQVP